MGFTLWLFHIAMENGPFIDDFPMKNGDVPWRTVSHNQMVSIKEWGNLVGVLPIS